jgi:hypothetical protein
MGVLLAWSVIIYETQYDQSSHPEQRVLLLRTDWILSAMPSQPESAATPASFRSLVNPVK